MNMGTYAVPTVRGQGLGPAAQGQGLGTAQGPGLGKQKHVVFATDDPTSTTPTTHSSTHLSEIPLHPRLQELLQPVSYPPPPPSFPSHGIASRPGLAHGNRASATSAHIPLFEPSSPDPTIYHASDPHFHSSSSKQKNIIEKLKTREVEHMLDVSAQGVTLAVRVYQQSPSDSGVSINRRQLRSSTVVGGKESDEKSSSSSSSSTPPPPSSVPSSYPSQRLSISAQDFVVSFGRPGRRRRRVMGRWKEGTID